MTTRPYRSDGARQRVRFRNEYRPAYLGSSIACYPRSCLAGGLVVSTGGRLRHPLGARQLLGPAGDRVIDVRADREGVRRPCGTHRDLTRRLVCRCRLPWWKDSVHRRRVAGSRLGGLGGCGYGFLIHPPTALLGQPGRHEGLLAFVNYAVIYHLVLQYADRSSRVRTLASVSLSHRVCPLRSTGSFSSRGLTRPNGASSVSRPSARSQRTETPTYWVAS